MSQTAPPHVAAPSGLPEIWQSVTWFVGSPDAEDPDCLCSLCGSLIEAGALPIRIFSDVGDMEARFHQVCFMGKARVARIVMASGETEILPDLEVRKNDSFRHMARLIKWDTDPDPLGDLAEFLPKLGKPRRE